MTDRRLTVADEERLSLAIQAAEPDKPEWLAARNELVAANTDLTIWYVKRVIGRFPGMDFEDIRQAACLGLIRAAESFDHKEGRFTTYAVLWMNQQVTYAFTNTEKLIRIPIHLYRRRKAGGMPAVTAMASQIPAFNDLASAKIEEAKDYGKIETVAAQALSFHDEPTQDLLCKYYGIGRQRMQLKDISKEMGVSSHLVHDTIRKAIKATRLAFLEQGVVAGAEQQGQPRENDA